MDTSHLRRFGFGEERWLPLGEWALLEPRDLTALIPRLPGVYVLRTEKPFGRFKGQSDIAYIGRSDRGQSLRGRIAKHVRPDYSGADNTSYRIREVLWGGPTLQLSWITTYTDSRAVEHECLFLDEYEKQHLELPPLNLRRANVTYRQRPVAVPESVRKYLRDTPSR